MSTTNKVYQGRNWVAKSRNVPGREEGSARGRRPEIAFALHDSRQTFRQPHIHALQAASARAHKPHEWGLQSQARCNDNTTHPNPQNPSPNEHLKVRDTAERTLELWRMTLDCVGGYMLDHKMWTAGTLAGFCAA